MVPPGKLKLSQRVMYIKIFLIYFITGPFANKIRAASVEFANTTWELIVGHVRFQIQNFNYFSQGFQFFTAQEKAIFPVFCH